MKRRQRKFNPIQFRILAFFRKFLMIQLLSGDFVLKELVTEILLSLSLKIRKKLKYTTNIKEKNIFYVSLYYSLEKEVLKDIS